LRPGLDRPFAPRPTWDDDAPTVALANRLDPAHERTQIVFDFVEGLDILGFFRNVVRFATNLRVGATDLLVLDVGKQPGRATADSLRHRKPQRRGRPGT
jgi:hypothetical protein